MKIFKFATVAAASLVLAASCETTAPETDKPSDTDTEGEASEYFRLSKQGSNILIQKNESVEMEWYDYYSNWSVYLSVDSNIDWEFGELPSWLNKYNEKKVGDSHYEFCLSPYPNLLSLSGDKAVIKFISGGEEVFSFELVLPSSEELVVCPYFRSVLSFSSVGVLNDGTEKKTYSGEVKSVQGTKLFAVAKTNGVMSVIADEDGSQYENGWCHISVEKPWNASSKALIQSVKYGIYVDENTTPGGRAASIVAVPASMRSGSFNPADDLFLVDKSALRDDLKIVTTVTQYKNSFTEITASGCTFRPIERKGDLYDEERAYIYFYAHIYDGLPVYILNFTQNDGSLTARYTGGNVYPAYQDFKNPQLTSNDVFAPVTRPVAGSKEYFKVGALSERLGTAPQSFMIWLWGDDHSDEDAQPLAFIYCVYAPDQDGTEE